MLLNYDINPAHPLLVAFAVLEETTALLGGAPRVMAAVSRDLLALFKVSGIADCEPIFIEGGYIFSLRFPLLGAPNPRAKISVTFSQVVPFHERWEWIIHLVSTPSFPELSVEDRITLLDLQRDILNLMVDNPATEDVDSSQPG